MRDPEMSSRQRGGRGFDEWMNLSIIRDDICALIHKRFHLKSYHNDIKYHMTQITILSVVTSIGYCSSLAAWAKIYLVLKVPKFPGN